MVVYEHVTVCHTNFILGGSSGNLTLSPGLQPVGVGGQCVCGGGCLKRQTGPVTDLNCPREH